MDFEDWKKESVDDEMRAGLEIAGEYFDLDYLWNAAKEISKQHWLNKAVEVVYDMYLSNSLIDCRDIGDKIKDLNK